MKKMLLMLSVFAVTAVYAQDQKPKLKDLLYSGKLKKDSSGVIRKTDDLSAKIDTAPKKQQPQPEIQKPITVTTTVSIDTAKQIAEPVTENSITTMVTKDSLVNEPVVVKENNAPAKTNTKLWKEYSDSLTASIKAEVLSSKQIKKGTYYMSFDYEIGTDGVVTVNTIGSTPDNSYLKAAVKQFLDSNPPRLNPVLDSNGQPKKTKRKQSYTITKE